MPQIIRTVIFRVGTPILGLGCLMMLYFILTNRELPSVILEVMKDPAHFQSFKILFISIVLEAFPFILLGVIFSALLQVFVTDELIRRIMPRNPIAGVLVGGLLGILFPLCECGMIPVVRRLIRKGMPAYIGIVYLLAGPIVNPIVFSSTFMAFRTTPEIAYARMISAFAIAVVIGLLLSKFMKRSPLRADVELNISQQTQHLFTHAAHTHIHNHHSDEPKRVGFRARASSTLSHASDEFFEMGQYLLIGALLTAIIQTVVSRDVLAGFAGEPILAYPFMMAFAYILSICSTSDAFIAASFSGIFEQGPLLAFLVFGPMIDFKNTLMLLSTFKLKIVVLLIALTAVLTLAGALIAEVLL
ncbi:permease [Paenibacillus sp. strain BS8-2]